MKNTYIVHAKRTAIGRFGGALSSVRVDDMMASLFSDFAAKDLFNSTLIDDIIVGCANQAGEDNRNLARMAAVLAGLPFEVPATTINRLCGSSLDATIDAWARIEAGLADCILVGGAESMSRAPYVMSKSMGPFDRGQKMWDTSIGWRFPNPKMEKIFPLYGMGETAEEVATLHKISREEQDKFSFNSHQKAISAIESGRFKKEILPLEIKKKKETSLFDTDEGPRKDSSLEKLASLRAAFREGGSVTAGNSSSINDGASMLVVVSEDFMKKHKLTPLARITAAGIRGRHPNTMGLGPVDAIKNLCTRFNKKTSDFDVIELNEAFAAQSLGCIKELELDPSKINLNGGAIALGHPLGCSGARILTTLIHIMKNDPSKKQGLASMCIGVGQGIALSIENCN
jgi:acetyl-CoA acyltransferase